MFTSIFVNGSLTAGSVFLSLGLALLLGFAGALYYTKRNSTATRSFVFTLALLPIIITTVIMVVNGNLGAGIAVAGSFSLIRFRSVLPESLDYEGLFDDLLDAYFASCELIRVRTVEMGTAYQLIYRGVLRDVKEAKQFLDAVRERNGNLPVALGRVADVRGEM